MDNLYFPAEWEHQRCIQLTWPHAGTDWADYLTDITETFVQLSSVITCHESLLVVTPDPSSTRSTLASRLSQEALHHITFFQCATNDTWARDHGALTLLPVAGSNARPRLLDFRFNGWGEKFPSVLDNAINRHLSLAGILGPLENHDDFILEGGSVESDGKGTVFTTSMCLLAPHRNDLDRDGLECELKRRLHADRVVWLDHGSLIGDDTDGHIDTIVRCAPDDTLLYVSCDDPSDAQYADFKALERQISSLRTLDGRPYRLLPLPMPRAIVEDGERLPATYANFLILNGAVVVPTYDQPDFDALAIETIGSAFPGREVVPLDARTIIRQHGSIHCLTMQYYSIYSDKWLSNGATTPTSHSEASDVTNSPSKTRGGQGALTTPTTPTIPTTSATPATPTPHPRNSKEMKSLRRQLRSNGTPAEGGLWKLLRAKQINGLQFRRQYSVGTHILDFYCPALKLAIELDGDYHYYETTQEHDMERDEELLCNFGIDTLRFENEIVFQQPQAIINSILEFQAKVTSRSTPAK